jgi:hypothetical protein
MDVDVEGLDLSETEEFEEEEEEEESPAFEKFGEISPPRVDRADVENFEFPSIVEAVPESESQSQCSPAAPEEVVSYLEPLPSLRSKLNYYLKYVDPLLMDEEVPMSSDDDEEEEMEIISVPDLELTETSSSWLVENGAVLRQG